MIRLPSKLVPAAFSFLALALAACATPQVYVPPQGGTGIGPQDRAPTTPDKAGPTPVETGDAASDGSEKEPPAAGPEGPLVPLLDSDWIVTELSGAPVPDSINMTLSFYIDRTIAGISGCNRYSGAADMDYETLRITALVSTGVNCPAKSGTLERDFLHALGDSASYRIDGPALQIMGRDGQVLAKLRTAG
ncbi:META domain-containing protein [Radicibacter daui]|uniref:META domain-containing protein n=1 Tax=Radicibacter daui TaxID=3064829 RepID=UPI004046BAC7